MFKKIVALSFGLILALGMVTQVHAATRVRGYTTKRGTHVQSYMRSDADSTRVNNYSHVGNYNPYTGKKGYKH